LGLGWEGLRGREEGYFLGGLHSGFLIIFSPCLWAGYIFDSSLGSGCFGTSGKSAWSFGRVFVYSWPAVGVDTWGTVPIRDGRKGTSWRYHLLAYVLRHQKSNRQGRDGLGDKRGRTQYRLQGVQNVHTLCGVVCDVVSSGGEFRTTPSKNGKMNEHVI
jgi:hypothetical protein